MAVHRVAVRTERVAAAAYRHGLSAQWSKRRWFHSSRTASIIKPFLLADIGEGITECQLIQWFVQPGARVEQFDKICEVQSDKASVEITSPYDGIVKKLHYETDDMAVTGKPLIDIDVPDDEETSEQATMQEATEAAATNSQPQGLESSDQGEIRHVDKITTSNLATPAVRYLIKEHGLAIDDISGTGRDGRVTKDDVQRHVGGRASTKATNFPNTGSSDRQVNLTPIQKQMFSVMTRSLSIPHFLYSCSTDMTKITELRRVLNATSIIKITPLSIILKAVSLSFRRHEILNASLDTSSEDKLSLTYHSAHHFGIAVDTPSGLVVPVIRDVHISSISEIAGKIRDVSQRARAGKLLPAELKGASFTVSNIGSIGGGVVSPVISEPQVAILGIGRGRIVPAFDAAGELCKKEELVLSWSADHRVVDGAECAKCAEQVRAYLESPEIMLSEMR